MRKSDLTYILVSVFTSMTAIFYCCTFWFSIRLPRYYPLEHTWKWVNEKGVPSQGWYAMQVFAFLAASIVTVVTHLALSRMRCADSPIRPVTLKVLGLLTTLVIVVCMYAILHHEFTKWDILR